MYISQRAVIKNKKQMKNLLTLFAIILSLGVTNAQTKKPVAKKQIHQRKPKLQS